MKTGMEGLGAGLRGLRVLGMALALLGLVTTGCAFDKEETLYPGDPLAGCDTVSVSFAGVVKPIITTQCLSCHDLAAANGGVVLEEHQDVLPYAQNGILVDVIEYNSPIKMPQTGKLPDCDIAKIRSWVRDGALNN